MNRVLHSVVLLVVILALALAASTTPVAAQGFAGGSGTAEDPYQIADWYQLHEVRNYLGDHFILLNDLDSNTNGYAALAGPDANGDLGWQPIGTEASPFTGSLNGGLHDIADMTIDRSEEDYVGLFGCVSDTGVIEAVAVVDCNVTGNGQVAGLVGDNNGTVRFCNATGTVAGAHSAGGLAGINSGAIYRSHAGANVYLEVSYAGGLVALNAGTIDDCHATGTVNGTGINTAYVGGLVGLNLGDASISRSCATASVTGWTNVGGLVGRLYGGTISNCHANGTVAGYGAVGGLVGSLSSGTIRCCYAAGSVTGTENTGGLAGYFFDGIVTDSFWDTETTEQSSSPGGATGKSTAEMQDIDTYTNPATTGLDSPWNMLSVAQGARVPYYTWNIVDGEDYPFLTFNQVHFALIEGWNLVAIPPALSEGERTVEEVFGRRIEAIYEWNPATGTYGEVTVLQPLHSYWVAVAEDTTVVYYV